VYTGKQCECEVLGLQPNTPYIYKLRAYTEGDESPFSDVVSIITDESGKFVSYMNCDPRVFFLTYLVDTH
jgi:hypothetical protein